MAFTYDLTTDIGKVRALVPDRDVTEYFFEDAEITAFLDMEGAVVKLAAALALETLASNEAYVQKVIKLLDLTTNGAQTSAALLARADKLREQAASEGLTIDYAENPLDVFSLREKMAKDAARGAS